MPAIAQININMKRPILNHTINLIILCPIFLFGNASASEWKPLCIEGSSCGAPYQVTLGGGTSGYNPVDSHSAGPLVTTEGILLHHTPFEFPVIDESGASVRYIFQQSASGSADLGDRVGYVSDVNSIQSPIGRLWSFGLGRAAAWFTSDEEVEIIDWSGRDAIDLNNAALTGPPVMLDSTMFIGIRFGGGQSIFSSDDAGKNWTERRANIRLGETRFNLLENPEKSALWGIHEEFFESPGSLWKSTDWGSTWQQVDDGSFPSSTVRVIHDPENLMDSYALTSHGLFVSVNHGVTWQATSMTEAIHGLVFVQRNEPLSRVLAVGTDTGVKVSVDEGVSWLNMSNGLLETPHTVTYGHGVLIATSSAGYFTCNSVDCAGPSQPLPPVEESGPVDVVEFYNTHLKHYFMTASQADIDLIEQGKAGEGWVRTGESFNAWSIGSTVEAANVCRFYGSIYPGPNSHFFTLSTQGCRSLMDLQETTPANEPRWNFENYAFSLMPPIGSQEQPCLEGFTPVYRAYNNGYQKGEDSNHRFVTNRELFQPLIEQGWTDEGVVFCSPAEQ